MWTSFTSSLCFVRANVSFTIMPASFVWALQLTALVGKPDTVTCHKPQSRVWTTPFSPLPAPSPANWAGCASPSPPDGFTFLCWNLSSEFRKFFSDEFLHVQNDLFWTQVLKWQINWSKILVPCLISSRTVGHDPCPWAGTVSLEGLRPAWLVSW